MAPRRWWSATAQAIRSPRRALATAYTFVSTLNRDHVFWLHMMAVRSGAAMTAMTVAGVVAYAMTLPFTLAATLIAGVALVAGAATVGIVAGSRFLVSRMRTTYAAMKKGGVQDNISAPAASVPAPAGALTRFSSAVAQSQPVKTLVQTRAWQQSEEFIRKQKKWMLGGTALGGAALTTGMSAWVLAAQVAVMPVVVLGSAVSFVALWAVAGVISGAAGLYFGARSLLDWHHASRAEKAADGMVRARTMTTAQDQDAGRSPVGSLSAKGAFAQKADAPRDDDSTPPADRPAPPSLKKKHPEKGSR